MVFWATSHGGIVSVCGEMWCCPCRPPWWATLRPFCAPQHKKGMVLMEKVQGRVTEVIKGARAHRTGGKAESLEKRRHWWDLTDVCKYLKEGCKKDGARPFTVVFSDMTRQRMQPEIQKVSVEQQETLFNLFWRWLSMGISCLERLWSSHPWKNSNTVCSGQLAPDDCAWAGMWD